MAKYCTQCKNAINEKKDKFCMVIGKKEGKIFEFECFHYSCWKSFYAQAVMVKVKEVFGEG